MHHLKTHILALVLIVIAVGLVYYNWRQPLQEGRYSMKLAAFGPVVGVGGVFLLLFPSMVGKPTTTKEKIIALTVIIVGLVAGLINWYLMDPGFSAGETTDFSLRQGEGEAKTSDHAWSE